MCLPQCTKIFKKEKAEALLRQRLHFWYSEKQEKEVNIAYIEKPQLGWPKKKKEVLAVTGRGASYNL